MDRRPVNLPSSLSLLHVEYPAELGEAAPVVDPSEDSFALPRTPSRSLNSPSGFRLEPASSSLSNKVQNPLYEANATTPHPDSAAAHRGFRAPNSEAPEAAAIQSPLGSLPEDEPMPVMRKTNSAREANDRMFRRTASIQAAKVAAANRSAQSMPRVLRLFGGWGVSRSAIWIGVLCMALAVSLQHSIGLGVELHNLRTSSEARRPWAPPGSPESCLAADDSSSQGGSSADSGEQTTPVTAGTVFMRIFAAALGLSCCVGTVLAWKHLDTLPQWMQQMVRSYLSFEDKSAASVAQTSPLSKHVAYKLDYWFSRNPWAKALSLIYVTVALIYVGGLGLYAASGQPLHEAFWEAIAGAGFDWKFSEVAVVGVGLSGFLMRAMSVAVSIGGMLITALLLGIVSDSIGDSMEGMRKGKADVLESGHTLILGWSDKLLAIIDQICNANVSEGGRPIVVLAEKDKEGMEEEINAHASNLRGSRVVVRSGNPLLSLDLDRVSADRARTIIVLASGSGPAHSDARVLRIVLSLMGLHDSRRRLGQEGLQGHIVAEVCDMDNDALVRMVGGDMVETVVSHDIIGRLMIQCARQPGLASVWEQLLGFDGGVSEDNLAGDEFYIREWPQLVGRSFQEVMLSFPLALPVGLKIAATGDVKLNPDDAYVIADGDKIIVLAEDDDTYRPADKLPDISEDLDSNPEWKNRLRKEKVLFIGWRRDMHDMVSVLDQFVAPGSELYLYNEVPPSQRLPILLKGGLDPTQDLHNIKLIFESPELEGDPVNRQRLEQLHPERFSSILILADDAVTVARAMGNNMTEPSIADADSRCLASLLLLRDIQSTRMPMGHSRLATVAGETKQAGNMVRKSWFGADLQAAAAAAMGGSVDNNAQASNQWYNTLMGAVRQTVVISEILDSRTRNLIAELHVGEFVLSNELVSMTLAMVSESREVNTILTELFTPNGNELYVLPAARFLGASEVLNFYEVLLRARARQEIVIGYKNFGMDKPVVNPKNKEERVLSVDLTDTLVVLSYGLDQATVKRKNSLGQKGDIKKDPYSAYESEDLSARRPSFKKGLSFNRHQYRG
ncbi:hypothetical protein WJX73_006994 [Symbiochloris irregularis]|uniref:CASTOR/POLLUX/SYM8 ion channel conserved domain-containing protein n=1 Tax=Symbiochloris irregularis TaxID=706552 RepID=A0AAW1PYC9_9CHLO